jgi:hypothetical protein
MTSNKELCSICEEWASDFPSNKSPCQIESGARAAVKIGEAAINEFLDINFSRYSSYDCPLVSQIREYLLAQREPVAETPIIKTPTVVQKTQDAFIPPKKSIEKITLPTKPDPPLQQVDGKKIRHITETEEEAIARLPKVNGKKGRKYETRLKEKNSPLNRWIFSAWDSVDQLVIYYFNEFNLPLDHKVLPYFQELVTLRSKYPKVLSDEQTRHLNLEREKMIIPKVDRKQLIAISNIFVKIVKQWQKEG